jgi:hypothetical protein
VSSAISVRALVPRSHLTGCRVTDIERRNANTTIDLPEGDMGRWGFRKTISFGRGARVTLGKKGVGLSFGFGPFRWGVHSKSGTRQRITLPGTGLFWESRAPWRSKRPTSRTPRLGIPQSAFFSAPGSANQAHAPSSKRRLNGYAALATVIAVIVLFLVLKLFGH